MRNYPWLEAHQQRLALALDSGRLGHAPLLSGPPGLGKRELAEWLLARILCLAEPGQAPCGQCRACELRSSGTHPDLFRIGIPEEKSEIPVDSVRDLITSLQLTPSIGQRRLGLIEPAESMNRNAANALLKTLEEPAANAWLILVSHRPERLPATIRSRCQQLTIRPPEPPEADAWLASQYPKHPPAERNRALSLAAGAPLAAAALLEGDGMLFGREVLDAMLAVASGAPVSAATSPEWQSDPVRTWTWLACWTAAFMRQCHGLDSDALPDGLKLPAALSGSRLAGHWEQALQGRRLAERALRHDLLLGKWLLEWGQSFQSGP